MDKCLKLEAEIDLRNEQISTMQCDLLQKNEEVECRKQIEESMTESMLQHENDHAKLASNLMLMKNQMIEYDSFVGTSKKYCALKINKMKDVHYVVRSIH